MENIIEYSINEAQITEETAMYKDIQLIPDDADSYAMVMAGLKAHRNIRLAIEKKRKSNGESAREYIAANNARAKELHALNDPGEQRLKDIRQVEDDRINEIKLEVQRVEKKRVDDIMIAIQDIKDLTNRVDFLSTDDLKGRLGVINKVRGIDTGFYSEFSGQAARALANTIEVVNTALAERKRLDKEDAERKLEAERLEEIRLQQEEAQYKIDAENARQEAERQTLEDEKARIAKEKQDEQERKDREAFEAKAKEEARIQADKDAKEKAKREAQEKIDSEHREKEEAARQEDLKPDKDKLLIFIDTIESAIKPELNSIKADEILSRAVGDIAKITERMRKETEVL